MKPLSEGDVAPSFDLPADGDRRLRLADFKGKIIVLYFYPRDDTEACTVEAIDFTARATAFEELGAVVIGVSTDPLRSHDRFKKKHDLTVPLASDVDHEVIGRYGSWVEKSMFGRKYMGTSRDTFVIGRDGRIARLWRRVRVPGHVEEVLRTVATL